MKKKQKLFLGFTVTLFAVIFTLAGCDNGNGNNGPTYYYETGGVSTTAYNLINSNPGLSAQQALAYCNQYPVAGDIYREAESGYTRSQLENDLNQLNNVPGFSKTQFLRMLDSTGAVFQLFSMVNNDIVYAYVEEE